MALSPNSRTIAFGGEKEIGFRDLCDDRAPVRRPVEAKVCCLTFSNDGRWLASGLDNGTILIWDMNVLLPFDSSFTSLTKFQRESCWSKLSQDAKSAMQAMNRLASDPAGTVPYLRERLKPIDPIDPRLVKSLLANLDSPRFAEREAASRRLSALGERPRQALEKLRTTTASTEVRNRTSKLLEQSLVIESPERRRYLRAIALVERIGNVQATELLSNLAKGDPQALETQMALESLRRISKQIVP